MRTWGRGRPSVNRLADPAPLPGEEPVRGYCTGVFDHLADEVEALPRGGHPTTIVSITGPNGEAILDLQLTADLRTVAVAVRTTLSELAIREQ